MSERDGGRKAGLAIIAAVLLLPLLGWSLAHSVGAGEPARDLAAVLEFPPRLRIPQDYPQFSWFVVGLVLMPFAALAAAWLRAAAHRSNVNPPPAAGPHAKGTRIRIDNDPGSRRPLPWWGWAAMAWTGAMWALAWNRFPWFAPGQRYTFFPLWLGFILSANALTCRRTGTCLMQRAPRRWLGLFALSAIFWWVFEWLNRFVRNWHYLGVEDFGPMAYALHATLCFSTVLPAVAAVREWISSHPRWRAGWGYGPSWPAVADRRMGAALIITGVGALVLTGMKPQWFFPALWAAPLALALGEGILARRPGFWREVAAGDWREVVAWAIAALICGFFWEMWNVRSVAKWIYTVPFVDRGHVFEMPLLGYLGYLPFGLECLIVIERVFGATDSGTENKADPAPAAR